MTDPQNIPTYLDNFPFLIKLAWAISFILMIAIIVLTFYLRFLRASFRIKDLEKTKLRTEYEALLVEYLYSGDDTNTISVRQQEIINILKKVVDVKAKRKIIISILYNLMNEVSGEMSNSIKTLYFKTGLYDFAQNRLKDKNWYINAKSIGELTRFKIAEAHDQIIPFIDHARDEVRKETQLYLVNMFRFDGLSFLNTLKRSLSEWAQIQLLETLQKIDDQEICDIKPWLKSSNNSVVLFALKLAKIYNQFEEKDTLMELLSHDVKLIRIKTIGVLTHLYGIEAKEMLKANFKDLSLKEQISFFELLEKLVVPTDEPFIEKHLFHKNFEIQLLALKILKSINLDKFIGIKEKSPKKSNPDILEFVNNI